MVKSSRKTTQKTVKRPTTRANSSRKPSASPEKNYYKILTFVFGFGFLALSIFTLCFCLPKLPTHEQEKRLEAFATLADEYVRQFEIIGEIDENGNEVGPTDTRTAALTGIGLSRDDDLYIDYILSNHTHGVPQSFQKVRAHLECRNAKFPILDSHLCHIGPYYYDEIPASDELKSLMQDWKDQIESSVNRANSTEDETELDQIHSEYEKIYKKFAEQYKTELLNLGFPESYFSY